MNFCTRLHPKFLRQKSPEQSILDLRLPVEISFFHHNFFSGEAQRYTYRVLQTIQMKLILLCVLAELAVSSSTKTALKFKYGKSLKIIWMIYLKSSLKPGWLIITLFNWRRPTSEDIFFCCHGSMQYLALWWNLCDKKPQCNVKPYISTYQRQKIW